eukprot:CAMPEP_0195297558 /NCGR_PEP_ID=MMETSP0707-20130614/21756_1 /TAXON_ID=33640 /ORGANISM="Asterionellopsis glacialis, Strain CCMP134" /LENGTH=64 /DNA_ID=CAMNT_0040359403 /DNA_START=10 /DNA_END=201 /DNA_ORIENTATION=-
MATTTTTTTTTTSSSSSTNTRMSSKAKEQMSIIVSYPELLSQEETMAKTPHNVTGWCLYLEHVD